MLSGKIGFGLKYLDTGKVSKFCPSPWTPPTAHRGLWLSVTPADGSPGLSRLLKDTH